jgi:hypothetical protein
MKFFYNKILRIFFKFTPMENPPSCTAVISISHQEASSNVVDKRISGDVIQIQ